VTQPASDHGRMAASLESAGDILPQLFQRFFELFPAQRAIFYNPETSCPRMMTETLDALLGIAEDAPWVPTMITGIVDLHRNYGVITADDYRRYLDLVIDTLAESVGPAWTTQADAAWRRQAVALCALIDAEKTARG
jgi:hemoglobin-like flavoprotein